jgi:large subunit ribosomal protein L24
MSKFNIKLNDKVKVLAGKDKGKEGKVIQILPADEMIVVEGVNKMYKHIRSQKKDEKGQRIEFSAPLAVGKLKVICPKCSKPSRLGLTVEGKKKFRVCKKCNERF